MGMSRIKLLKNHKIGKGLGAKWIYYLVWCVPIENGQVKLEQISQLFPSLVPKRMNEMKEVVISLSYQIYYFSLPYFCEKTIFLVYALVRATIAVMNNHDQRQLEEEFIWFTYPGLQSPWGKPTRWEPGSRSWIRAHGSAAYWLVCRLIEPRTTSPGKSLPTVDLALLH